MTYVEKKKRKTHFTTPSPAGCIKVHNSLLLSIRLCHLTSQIAIPSRKPDATTSGFQAGAGISAAGVMPGLGSSSPLILGNFTFKESSQETSTNVSNRATCSPSGVGRGPVGTAPGFLSSLNNHQSSMIRDNRILEFG